MTTVLNLYGGPGTGKSTLAAYAYYMAKKAGVNAELVREYVKDWAWEGRQIGPFDQFYFMAKHMRKESMLYDKVDFVVTDSPIILPILYSRAYSPAPVADGIEAAVKQFYKASEEAGHTNLHVFLQRRKPYNPAGRFQTEAEARALDDVTRNLLDELEIPYEVTLGDETGIKSYLQKKKIGDVYV